MFGVPRRRVRRRLLSVLLGVTALGLVVAVSFDVDLPPDGGAGKAAVLGEPGPPCGPRTSTTIASVDGSVARRIYLAELHGYETKTDIARIAKSQALLTALQSSDQAAVYAAVHAIVYTPHWHIVRLRVRQNGKVLADVGGPDVIAPVSRALRVNGKVVGDFVMSVQDDVGYVKLISRFIGVPIDIYREGSFVMGTLRPPPNSVSNGDSLTVGYDEYRALIVKAAAFPSGKLKVVLFVPAQSSTLAGSSCASVRLSAWGSIATHVAARFISLSSEYDDFLHTLQGISGGRVFVRSGSAHLAGRGPSRLPHDGTVRYKGRSWAVFSWVPVSPNRIYFLIPL